MSKESAAQAGGGRPARMRRAWTVDIGDPDTVLTGARRALFVMVGDFSGSWALQIVNVADATT